MADESVEMDRPFSETGGAAYLPLIARQLDEERDRKRSIETRSMWFGTAAGALLAALPKLVLKSLGWYDHLARLMAASGALLLIGAVVSAIAALALKGYDEPLPSSLRALVEEEEWARPRSEAASRVAITCLDTLTDARQVNDHKSRALVWATHLFFLGILAVGVSGAEAMIGRWLS